MKSAGAVVFCLFERGGTRGVCRGDLWSACGSVKGQAALHCRFSGCTEGDCASVTKHVGPLTCHRCTPQACMHTSHMGHRTLLRTHAGRAWAPASQLGRTQHNCTQLVLNSAAHVALLC